MAAIWYLILHPVKTLFSSKSRNAAIPSPLANSCSVLARLGRARVVLGLLVGKIAIVPRRGKVKGGPFGARPYSMMRAAPYAILDLFSAELSMKHGFQTWTE